MNHKEMIQALIDGHTLKRKSTRDLISYDAEHGLFWNDTIAGSIHPNNLCADEWDIYEKPKRWRAKIDGAYWFINSRLQVRCTSEWGYVENYEHYNDSNYFKTNEEAHRVADALMKVWKEYRSE